MVTVGQNQGRVSPEAGEPREEPGLPAPSCAQAPGLPKGLPSQPRPPSSLQAPTGCRSQLWASPAREACSAVSEGTVHPASQAKEKQKHLPPCCKTVLICLKNMQGQRAPRSVITPTHHQS